MRTKLLLGAIAFGLVITDPAICAQNTPLPPPDGMPTEQDDPANPNPVTDPVVPSPSRTEPLPPEMPMPAGEAQQMPPAPMTPPAPVVIDRSPPPGPMATPPSSGANRAVSGATNSAMLTPRPTTKTYPLCTRGMQDNCRNPGEGPKR